MNTSKSIHLFLLYVPAIAALFLPTTTEATLFPSLDPLLTVFSFLLISVTCLSSYLSLLRYLLLFLLFFLLFFRPLHSPLSPPLAPLTPLPLPLPYLFLCSEFSSFSSSSSSASLNPHTLTFSCLHCISICFLIHLIGLRVISTRIFTAFFSLLLFLFSSIQPFHLLDSFICAFISAPILMLFILNCASFTSSFTAPILHLLCFLLFYTSYCSPHRPDPVTRPELPLPRSATSNLFSSCPTTFQTPVL